MPTAALQNPLYSFIGQRIRERRKLLKLSQSKIAAMMGFSTQQLQKYESGISQLSVGRLLQFARVLNVPALYFYDGARLDDDIGKSIASDVIQPSRTEPLHVLLVENKPADVLLFRNALKACPEQVDLHVIHDSETVGDFLCNHRPKFGKDAPDIVVLDLALPKVPGLQLLKAIKKSTETAQIPVVILTSSISKKEMQEAYSCGAAGFIQKSVDMEQYMASIEAAMRYWAKAVALPGM